MAALIIRLNSVLEFIHSVKRDSDAFQVVEMKEKEILIRQRPVASKETTDDGKRSVVTSASCIKEASTSECNVCTAAKKGLFKFSFALFPAGEIHACHSYSPDKDRWFMSPTDHEHKVMKTFTEWRIPPLVPVKTTSHVNYVQTRLGALTLAWLQTPNPPNRSCLAHLNVIYCLPS